MIKIIKNLTVLIFLIIISTSIAGTVQIQYDRRFTNDATVISLLPGRNGGYDYTSLIRYYSSDSCVVRSYIQIPLPSIVTSVNASLITSAKIKVFMGYLDEGKAFDISVNEILNEWNEDEITWNNKPAHDPKAIDSFTVNQELYWLEVQITTLVKNWISGEKENYGLVFKPLTEEPPVQGSAAFRSSDDPEYSLNPILEITSPELPDTLVHYIDAQKESWKLLYRFNENEVSSITFKDRLNGLAASSNYSGTSSKIFKTTNRGETWDYINIENLNVYIGEIKYLNDNTVLGIGSKGTIIKSTDSGSSWTVKNIDSLWLLNMCTTPDGKVFVCACSAGSKIYKSTDSGDSWTIKEIAIEDNVQDIAFANDLIGYGVFYSGISMKTTDGGETWIPLLPSIDVSYPAKIKFVDENIGFCASGGKILKTSDGGNSWFEKYTYYGLEISDITSWGSKIAWATGGPEILKTTDAGENWFEQSFYPYTYLTTICSVDSIVCYAAGDQGRLFKTTDGSGITSIKKINTTAEGFNLSQNYPNPFNPSTIISFTLPQSQNVELKVFDILGKEVAVLLNEYKPAGEHKVEFEETNLSSGIYFYRLKTRDFIQTKKLILLK